MVELGLPPLAMKKAVIPGYTHRIGPETKSVPESKC